MAHGGYGRRRVAERKPLGRRSKGLAVEKKPKPKSVSIKNQIRSIERMLRKVHCYFLLLIYTQKDGYNNYYYYFFKVIWVFSLICFLIGRDLFSLLEYNLGNSQFEFMITVDCYLYTSHCIYTSVLCIVLSCS